MVPGEYVLSEEPILCNEGREVLEMEVTNTGDRPVQVGSHFHFFEANRALELIGAPPAGSTSTFRPVPRSGSSLVTARPSGWLRWPEPAPSTGSPTPSTAHWTERAPRCTPEDAPTALPASPDPFAAALLPSSEETGGARL